MLFPYISAIKPAIPFTNRYFGFNLCLSWCTRQELNLHGVNHKILSLARLPIPPRVLTESKVNFIIFLFDCQAKTNGIFIFFENTFFLFSPKFQAFLILNPPNRRNYVRHNTLQILNYRNQTVVLYVFLLLLRLSRLS